ncbi:MULTISPECIES: hypothetical protein [unclassified Auritidibacter]|uniref:hypothetical protein n=1 Tax=unclassified Auritidibacter TaxID=2634694 RepID=UPI0011B21F07|nr:MULTISPECIES: hypothetical protein [unclassified Auritidibacter]
MKLTMKKRGHVPSSPLHPMVLSALFLSLGLALSGCQTEEGGPEPEDSANTSSSPSDESSVETSRDDLSEILIPAEHLPEGGATEFSIESFQSQPLSLYLTLTGFEPEGTCGEAIDAVNSYTSQVSHGVTGVYDYGADASDSPSPSESEETSDTSSDGPETQELSGEPHVEIMVFETAEETRPMKLFSEVAESCDTIESDSVDGAEATFEQLESLHAVHVGIKASRDDDLENLYLGGGSVGGQYHVYIVANNISPDDALSLYTEQIQRLEQLVDPAEVDDTSSATESASPDESSSI